MLQSLVEPGFALIKLAKELETTSSSSRDHGRIYEDQREMGLVIGS